MLYLLVRLFSSLPLGILQLIGGAVGIIIYLSSPRYKARLNKNLNFAADKYSFKPKYLSAAVSAGMMFGDSLWIWRNEHLVLKKIRIDNEDELINLATNGNGLIVLAAHFGGFECIPHIFTQKVKTTAMYRPAKKSWVNNLMMNTREGSRINFVPAGLGGVRVFKRALSNGEVVALVADQVPNIKDGIWSSMFNQNAYTTTFPFKLRQNSPATTVFISAQRVGLGRGWVLQFRISDPIHADTASNATTEMNHAFEEMIIKAPNQYLWSYNRFKEPIEAIVMKGN